MRTDMTSKTSAIRAALDANKIQQSKANILAAALKVAARPDGWAKLTRAAVAKEAGCSEGLPSKYFGTMTVFRRAVMRTAIASENLSILAQGLAASDPTAIKAPQELKTRAVALLAGE